MKTSWADLGLIAAMGDWCYTTDKGKESSECLKAATGEMLNVYLMAAMVKELVKLNRLLGCENFRDIPAVLRLIRANTATPKRKRKRAVK